MLFHADVAGASVGGTLSDMIFIQHLNIGLVLVLHPHKVLLQKILFSKVIILSHNTYYRSDGDGTYVRSLTIPKDTPTELEIIIQGWICGSGNGVTRLTITRNGVVVYKEKKLLHMHIVVYIQLHLFITTFKEGDVLTFQTKQNNSVNARDFEQTDYTTPWAKASGSITIKALNSVGKSLIQKESYGQTLETIAGVCDGRTIKGESGIYTLPACNC